MSRKFQIAAAFYVFLGTLAGFTLSGDLRTITLLVLGAFFVKTWIADIQQRQQTSTGKESRSE